MRLPWIARTAYNVVLDERDRLRAQNDELLGHVVRMDRVEHGKPEIAPERKQPSEPMPREIMNVITGFGSHATRQRLENEAWAVYRQHGSWNTVMSRLKEMLES